MSCQTTTKISGFLCLYLILNAPNQSSCFPFQIPFISNTLGRTCVRQFLFRLKHISFSFFHLPQLQMTFVQAAPQVNPGIFPSLKAKSSQMSNVFSDISKQNECSEVISISLPVFVLNYTSPPPHFHSFSSFCPLFLFSLHVFPFACSPNVC